MKTSYFLSAPRVDGDGTFDLFPGGEMVSQRTLNPLFLVRVQAWEREFMMRREA